MGGAKTPKQPYPGLGHIVLYICDLDKSTRFYQEIGSEGIDGATLNGKAVVLPGS